MISLDTVLERKRIMELICMGNIPEAISSVNSAFPTLLQKNVDVYFRLQSQWFIELIRQKKVTEALKFAQNELSSFASKDKKFMEYLQDTFALIAYDEPEMSPVASYLSEGQKEEVAEAVNTAILESLSLPSNSPIERIVKQITVIKETLYQDSVSKGPRWRFRNFLNETKVPPVRNERSQSLPDATPPSPSVKGTEIMEE